MRTVRLVGLLVVVGLFTPQVWAADVPVSYLVDQRTLTANAPAGTALTFTLYNDNACTSRVASQVVNVENVQAMEWLKLLTPRGASPAPLTARLTTTLPGVTAGGNLYLTVTGTGVTPRGAACQAQATVEQGGALTTLRRVTIAFCPDSFSGWCVQNDPTGLFPVLPLGFGFLGLPATDRQVAAVLQVLDHAVRYLCDLDMLLQEGLSETGRDGSRGAVYGISNCTPLPSGCTSGNGSCGGPCPPCEDLQPCTSSADCTSGHCQAATASCFAPSSVSVCIPTHCFDGVKDDGETDVDCGGRSCRTACALGKMCSANCDCASGNCNQVCQTPCIPTGPHTCP